MEKTQLFRAEKVNNHITRIYMPGDVQTYLVEGTKEAVIIDTGCGIGDFKGYVDTLTDKPVTVLLTHGHLDHAPGSPAFEKVYMNMLDREIYINHHTKQQREGYVMTTSFAEQFDSATLVEEESPDRFHALEDGMRFDLGDYHITAFSCPGHTRGSMVFLMEEDRILLLGDACNPFTFLFDVTTLTVSEYEESLKKLDTATRGKYDATLLSHGVGTPSRNMIRENIQNCEFIKAGKVDNVPFEFLNRTAYIAFIPGRLNEYGEGMANIVYNPERIM